jgi:hypothetical protein
MAQVVFTMSFDSSYLTQQQIDSALEHMYEYCGIGGFTDDFNPILNSAFNVYCVATDSGTGFFKYLVFKGWTNPVTKHKPLDHKSINKP